MSEFKPFVVTLKHEQDEHTTVTHTSPDGQLSICIGNLEIRIRQQPGSGMKGVVHVDAHDARTGEELDSVVSGFIVDLEDLPESSSL